ncbi:hypothetical protein CVS27_09270 [Arthrobacter glacialis]|uniref:CorA-like Mg2+ transporter protein n=2 Tax=Arthrobacter glacialis TaxID=1664 RepID=A0A2S3ZWI4_ARTGL|nr:hypothetical protein CVS27_09270 [Arthrobacter glacialis]
MDVDHNADQPLAQADVWDPPDTSSAVLILPLNHSLTYHASTIQWQPGVLRIVLPMHTERLEPWAESVTNEKDRLALVSPGPGSVLYQSAAETHDSPAAATGRLHHLLPTALDLSGMVLVALEFLALPRSSAQQESGPGCAVLALHLTFPACDDESSSSLATSLERLRQLSYWNTETMSERGTEDSRMGGLCDFLATALPPGWEPPNRGTRLGVCTLLMQRDAAKDGRFQEEDWMYLAISSRVVSPASISLHRRRSLPVLRISKSWRLLVLRDGVSVMATSDEFTRSLQAYFHSVYLDAVLLARLQALRATELAALVPSPELTDVFKLRELEGAVLDFRRRIWWSYLTGKRTSPGDTILNHCQAELRLAEQVDSLAANAADAARLSASLHHEALTKAQDLTRAAQEQTNVTIQILTVLLAPLALSYAAFTVAGSPSVTLFWMATATGFALTLVAALVLRTVRKRQHRDPQ